jgi:cell division ATPase FtsA
MESKKWYSSKTIWGVIIALLGFILSQYLKVDISLPESDVLTPSDIESVKQAAQQMKEAHGSVSVLVSQIMVIVGSLLGVYGRFKAKTSIA